MIAALFVSPSGVYIDVPGVDPWPESRDARLYAGPHSVVAHPPCSRWCRLAGLVEARWGHKRGDDDGTIARDPAASVAARSKWLARRCTKTCEEAGIRHLSPHALRHTVAPLAITSGADVHSVQALLGHEDARVTTRIYSHAIAGAQAMGAARAVGDYLERAVAARPLLRPVR